MESLKPSAECYYDPATRNMGVFLDGRDDKEALAFVETYPSMVRLSPIDGEVLRGIIERHGPGPWPIHGGI